MPRTVNKRITNKNWKVYLIALKNVFKDATN